MTNAAAARPRQRFFYGWYIAYGGALSNFVTIGIAAFSLTVFIGPLRDEMGWTAAAITFGFSLGTLEQGLLAPFTGFLIDRLGPRKMAATGVVILACGLLLFSQARSLEVYYLASLLMATGNSIGSLMAFSAAVMNWFERKRARAMGVLNAGNGAGYFVVPIVALLVSWLGWRETLMIASAIVLIVGFPLALLLRDRPQPFGYLPDGEPPEDRSGAPLATPALTGYTVGAGLRIPAFYLLALANACGTFAIVGVGHPAGTASRAERVLDRLRRAHRRVLRRVPGGDAHRCRLDRRYPRPATRLRAGLHPAGHRDVAVRPA